MEKQVVVENTFDQWPEWLLMGGEKIVRSLAVVSGVAEQLFNEADRGYEYEHPLQFALNSIRDQIVSAGGPRTNTFIEFPPDVQAMFLSDISSSHRTLGSLIALERIAVVKLLRATTSAINSDDLLVPMVCIRSIVEHVSNLHQLYKIINTVSVPPDGKSANVLLGSISEQIKQKLYATRIDWDKILTQDESAGLHDGSIKYTPLENRLDRTARSVLSAIDSLDREIKGTRAIYDLLCEVAHPNVGNLLMVTVATEPFYDQMRTPWVRKKIGLSPPASFVKEAPIVLERIFQSFAEVLKYFSDLLLRCEEQNRKILEITQIVVRDLVQLVGHKLDPYISCPCGSGKKLKFCCKV